MAVLLVPGAGYVQETLSGVSALVPGAGYVTEASGADGSATGGTLTSTASVTTEYVAPVGSGVAFSFVGMQAYTAPGGGSVAFGFTPFVTGTASTTGVTVTATASVIAGTATGGLTIARPNADTATGGWTPSAGVTLFGCIDEMTYDDADYISTTTTTAATMALSTVNDPLSSTGHVIRFRAKSPNSNTLTVTLKQGGTTIKTETPTALTGSFADYSMALSGAEADSITDYSALTITLEAV